MPKAKQAAKQIIEEIIECAVNWNSADADHPDTPPTKWQDVFPVLKAAPAMKTDLESGINAAQTVVDRWERGDLADAVRALDEWMKNAKQTFLTATASEDQNAQPVV